MVWNEKEPDGIKGGKIMEEIVSRINEVFKLDIDNNTLLDISRSEIITKIIAKDYDWKDITQAFIQILADSTRTSDTLRLLTSGTRKISFPSDSLSSEVSESALCL